MDTGLLGRVSGGENLTVGEMEGVIAEIMNGEWEKPQISLLLAALHAKGETAEEVAGAALAMRRHMTKIPTDRTGVVDTCGTGGDGSRDLQHQHGRRDRGRGGGRAGGQTWQSQNHQ